MSPLSYIIKRSSYVILCTLICIFLPRKIWCILTLASSLFILVCKQFRNEYTDGKCWRIGNVGVLLIVITSLFHWLLELLSPDSNYAAFPVASLAFLIPLQSWCFCTVLSSYSLTYIYFWIYLYMHIIILNCYH